MKGKGPKNLSSINELKEYIASKLPFIETKDNSCYLKKGMTEFTINKDHLDSNRNTLSNIINSFEENIKKHLNEMNK